MRDPRKNSDWRAGGRKRVELKQRLHDSTVHDFGFPEVSYREDAEAIINELTTELDERDTYIEHLLAQGEN